MSAVVYWITRQVSLILLWHTSQPDQTWACNLIAHTSRQNYNWCFALELILSLPQQCTYVADPGSATPLNMQVIFHWGRGTVKSYNIKFSELCSGHFCACNSHALIKWHFQNYSSTVWLYNVSLGYKVELHAVKCLIKLSFQSTNIVLKCNSLWNPLVKCSLTHQEFVLHSVDARRKWVACSLDSGNALSTDHISSHAPSTLGRYGTVIERGGTEW